MTDRRSVSRTVLAILLVIAIFLAGAAYFYVSELEEERRWRRVAVVYDPFSLAGEFSQDALLADAKQISGSLLLRLIEVGPERNAEASQLLQQISSTASYDVIVGLGERVVVLLEDVALKFPNQKYVAVDASPSENRTNVLYVLFALDEEAAVAGALAAAISKSGFIGVVGQLQNLPDLMLEIGFRYGANWLENRSGKTVQVRALGHGASTDSVRLMVEELVNGGTDVLFGTNVLVSQLVIESVRQVDETFGWRWGNNERPPIFSVGVGKDLDHLGTRNLAQPAPPGTTLTSVIKKLHVGALKALAAYVHSGFRGGVIVVGLADGGVGLSNLTYTRQYVSNETIQQIETLASDISNGVAQVPVVTRENVEELRARYP